ncbi:MAG: DNA alkylation repair protein [Aquabacterium sp.]|nr:DNA alkylation repair protein [Aquabacterium sp.]
MMEPFKNLINADVVRQMGHHLKRADSSFKRQRFEQLALEGLDALAFKDRALHLSRALRATLPADFNQSADQLEASLKRVPAPRLGHDPDKELGTLQTDDTGLAGWALWAFGEYVAQQGLAHPERALRALHAITQRFTAEFAIRPFIVEHPQLTFATLSRWLDDPSAHVRRLVSEGSRPRLPWGQRLQALVQDPSPTLPLLRRLQDDPSEYVRRSVANHLNDIAKDHPTVLVNWLHAHLPDASDSRRRLLRHASRSLIKAGHADTLTAWGMGQAFVGDISVTLDKRRVAVGEALTIQVSLHARGNAPQTLELDYRVHHLKANGETSPKTFKGKRITLQPGEQLVWRKVHTLKPVSTRRYYPGPHALDIQVNGVVHGLTPFMLTA